ncbi:unnamed protein product, partial [Meganyctiphanes norvegica]
CGGFASRDRAVRQRGGACQCRSSGPLGLPLHDRHHHDDPLDDDDDLLLVIQQCPCQDHLGTHVGYTVLHKQLCQCHSQSNTTASVWLLCYSSSDDDSPGPLIGGSSSCC